MEQIFTSSASELAQQLADKEISARELTDAYIERIEATDGELNAFITTSFDVARQCADDVDAARQQGLPLHQLAGVPIAVKDLVVTEGIETTAASKILGGWIPPYDATVITKLKAAGIPILGKTNMDEFAMGSSTEFSAFGLTHNPWGENLVPGGSGGGSAAAVANASAPWAIGSDTGGSIRQPAAFTGTVGVKPTYGSISRYGVIGLASSLDQLGPATRTVLDAALLHELLAGHDPHDSTSLPDAVPSYSAAAQKKSVQGLKIGVLKEFADADFDADIKQRFEESIELLQGAGAEIIEIDTPNFKHAMAAYYVILPAEASSNLAKFDGMRFGLRVEPDEGPVTAERVMAATRGAGFGPEVKRRLILGTYVLSAGSYDSYYLAAQRVRTLVQQDFAAAFEQVDVLVSPSTPTTAFEFGAQQEDATSRYLNDLTTLPVNLAGNGAISVPNGLDSRGRPTGFQVIAPVRQDELLYQVGGTLEDLLVQQWQATMLQQNPRVKAAQ